MRPSRRGSASRGGGEGMIRKRSESGTVEFLLDRDAAGIPRLMGSWDGWQSPAAKKYEMHDGAAHADRAVAGIVRP